MATETKTQFFLKGFTQENDFRTFAFDGIGADKMRVPVSVRIDTALARQHGIKPQDLPLLCRSLLDRCHDREDVMTFGEDEMCKYKKEVTARESLARNRNPPRPKAGQTGAVPASVDTAGEGA